MNEGLVIYNFYDLSFILANIADPDDSQMLRCGVSSRSSLFLHLNVFSQFHFEFSARCIISSHSTPYLNSVAEQVGQKLDITLS